VTGEVYNIGTDKERTVKEVAEDIARAFDLPSSKVVHVKVRAGAAWEQRGALAGWQRGMVGVPRR
jgi:nucleoside-diphosphate-sugar epimerase